MGFLYGNLYTLYIDMWLTMFWTFQEFHSSYMCQLPYNYCTCVITTIIMLQQMYNVHTCDHATCPHFHHPLWDTFAISFRL
jgi:hypothetical protein